MEPQNTSSATKYIMTNKATGATQEMYAHTFGNGFVDFALASEAGTGAWTTNPTLTRFNNEHSDGMLTNEEYDIHVDLGEVLTADAPAESVVVTDEVAG